MGAASNNASLDFFSGKSIVCVSGLLPGFTMSINNAPHILGKLVKLCPVDVTCRLSRFDFFLLSFLPFFLA